jgi:hypothetical protein
MAKITQTFYVRYDTDKNCDLLRWPRWDLSRSKYEGDTYVNVGTAEVTFDVPDDFDPRPLQVKALEAKRAELHAQFAAAVTEINRQINELLAIDNTPADVREVSEAA